MTEGYIKFNCRWSRREIQIPDDQFQQLEAARRQLYQLELIGMNRDGIGFGNISLWLKNENSFVITGSATGQFAALNPWHYALVSGYSFERNSVTCTGLTKASAESLTHAAVYEAIPEVEAVVHVHCLWLWEKLLYHFPTTSPEIEYGTPEMALAVKQLAGKANSHSEKIIIMGGHEEGILTWGSTLAEATEQIVKIFNQYK